MRRNSFDAKSEKCGTASWSFRITLQRGFNLGNLLDGIVEIVESMDAVIEDIKNQEYPAKKQS